MIVIPIASIAYMVLFVALILAVLFPATKIILMAYQYIMVPVTGVAVSAASIAINNIPVQAKVGLGCMLYGALVITSDYMLVEPRKKIIAGLVLVCASLLIMFI